MIARPDPLFDDQKGNEIMSLDQLSKSLLEKIFKDSVANSKGIDAIRFRAEHHKHLDLLDALELAGYLERRENKYKLRLLTLLGLFDSVDEVQVLLHRCDHLFQVLRQYYIEHPGERVSLNDLSKKTGIPRKDINIGLSYMVEAPIFGMVETPIFGYWTTNSHESEDVNITPSEGILKYQEFGEILEEMQSLQERSSKVKVAETWVVRSPENMEDFRVLLHPIITEHALPQYDNGHLRGAVLDSIIAVFDLIRQKTGLREDGDKLIGKVFSLHDPYLILSDIDTESGQNDQKGFMQILKGSFQGIRNPKAHSLTHDLTAIKAAQYLVFASLLARRIDEAKVIKTEQG
jgi:uncharacterized protein (TIGR02391 family)